MPEEKALSPAQIENAISRIKFGDIDAGDILAKLPPGVKERLAAEALETVDRALGFTPARAAEFIAESISEHPEKDARWHRDDAIGKFKRFLRVDRRWQGAVDVAWPHIDQEAARVVDTVLALAADDEAEQDGPQ